jgi:hypothetical protein
MGNVGVDRGTILTYIGCELGSVQLMHLGSIMVRLSRRKQDTELS